MKTKKLKVEVRRKEIKNGKCQDRFGCAIALGLLRIPGLIEPCVGQAWMSFIYQGSYYSVATPYRAGRFMSRFDDTDDEPAEKAKLKPFSFQLALS